MNDHLMTSRRFAPLFWTQFLSAFNDNFLKNTLVFLILFTLGGGRGGVAGHAGGGHFHGPLPAAVGAGRRAGRPFRQGGDGAIAEARRDRRGRRRGRRHRAVLDPGADGRAVYASASSRRCSARSNTASCPIISSARNCRAPMPGSSPRTFAAILGGTIVGGLVSAEGISVLVFGPMMMAWRSAAGWSAATSRRPARRRPTSSSTGTYCARPGVWSASCRHKPPHLASLRS